jgi:hypothetical protein
MGDEGTGLAESDLRLSLASFITINNGKPGKGEYDYR